MSDWRDRIVMEADIRIDKPGVKGTRISVELILGGLRPGWTLEQILESDPPLTRADVLAALSFAAAFMRRERQLIASAPGGSA